MTLAEIIQRANEALADGSLARCLDVEPHYAAMLVDAAIADMRSRKGDEIAQRMRNIFAEGERAGWPKLRSRGAFVQPDENGINAAESRHAVMSELETLLRRFGH